MANENNREFSGEIWPDYFGVAFPSYLLYPSYRNGTRISTDAADFHGYEQLASGFQEDILWESA